MSEGVVLERIKNVRKKIFLEEEDKGKRGYRIL